MDVTVDVVKVGDGDVDVAFFFLFSSSPSLSTFLYSYSVSDGCPPDVSVTAGRPPYDHPMKATSWLPWSARGLRDACPTTFCLWDGRPTALGWPGCPQRGPPILIWSVDGVAGAFLGS